MTEHLPYEDELRNGLNDLPLPDQDLAWADMKRRLDEDDDDKVPPIWLRGCAVWGLLGILLLGIAWWIFRPEKRFSSHSNQSADHPLVKSADEKKNRNRNDNVKSVDLDTPSSTDRVRSNEAVKDSAVAPERTKKVPVAIPPVVHQRPVKQTAKKNKDPNEINQPTSVKTDHKQINKNPGNSDSTKSNVTVMKADEEKKKTPLIQDTTNAPKKKARPVAETKTSPSQPTTTSKDSSKTQRHFSFAAGLGMQQQLPIGGQKLTPYNASGRKGSLADYIPSVYLRLYREDKWFLQSEFKYGAPNYTKGFLYNQVIVTDTSGTTVTTSSTSLKKTFYHQLPVSFNYFIKPGFSVGAGIVWNKFSAAISSRDIIQHNTQTAQDLTLEKGAIIIIKPDSLSAQQHFSKSYLQALFETQYKWNRFSVGARYAFGLQPYLRFDLPGSVPKEEKNSSLQIFIHYELWRAGKR